MKLVFILAALLISLVELGQSTPDHHRNHHLWHSWKKVHVKQYENEDVEARRFDIWKKAVERINEHNLRHDLGLETYRMGVNQFTDLTWDEFKQQYLGGLIEVDQTNTEGPAEQNEIDTSDFPEEWDWRNHSRVTPVKDQLVDCSISFGNYGCSGGLMDNAFRYASEFGMETEEDYRYRAMVEICKYEKSKTIFRIDSYRRIGWADENDLLDALYRVGPVSVAVDVESDFMNYRSGVFSSQLCSQSRLNHGVLAVGFGVEKGEKYWLVKNSWGTWWGEQGYIKIARGMNMCGIASMASVPLIK